MNPDANMCAPRAPALTGSVAISDYVSVPISDSVPVSDSVPAAVSVTTNVAAGTTRNTSAAVHARSDARGNRRAHAAIAVTATVTVATAADTATTVRYGNPTLHRKLRQHRVRRKQRWGEDR